MSSPAPVTATVEDIAAMSDAELTRFMERHRQPNGGYQLPVDGWDKLPEKTRSDLAERLKRASLQITAQSPTACSRPLDLDLDELDARLGQIASDDNDVSSRTRRRSSPLSRSPTDSLDEEGTDRRCAILAYDDLVNDGGRPLYPIDLLEQVFQNAKDYEEMLRPWKSPNDPEARQVFAKQLQRWQDFRKWQNDHRQLEDDESSFPAFVEGLKRLWKPHFKEHHYARWLAQVEADPSSLKAHWESMQVHRQWHRLVHRESGCDGFPDYVEAVKRRLIQHNFTRPVQLKDAPKQQDKLTTWIEYLNFEYWWFDKYTKSTADLKPDHDKAWQKLVDLEVLSPGETQEVVRTLAFSFKLRAESDLAKKAVQEADSEARKTYTLTQKDPQRLSIDESKRISMLEAALTGLQAAKKRLQLVERRSHHILDFTKISSKYAEAEENAARHGLLLPWILDQGNLIEAEMADADHSARQNPPDPESSSNSRSASQAVSHGVRRSARIAARQNALIEAEMAGESTERRLAADADHSARQNTKRPRLGDWGSSSNSGSTPQATSQGVRRSARIAARQNASGTHSAPDSDQPASPPRPRTRPPKPSRARPSVANLKASATKGGPKSSGRRGVAEPRRTSRRSLRPRRRNV